MNPQNKKVPIVLVADSQKTDARKFYPKPGQKEYTLDKAERVWGFGPATLGCTMWEHLHGIDVIGSELEKYDIGSERFVLDWDDTCKDTGIFWIQAHREVLTNFGFDKDATSDDAILALFGNIHVADKLGIEKFAKDDKQFSDDEVWGLIKSRASELLGLNPMDPLLIQALKISKKMGVRLSVWSSSPREILLNAIESNGLEDMFDAVVSVDDVDPDKHKPNTQGLLIAVRAMDIARGYLQSGEDYTVEKPLKMNGVWMLGDSPNDVLAGKHAGTSTVWLENPLQGHNAHENRKDTLRRIAKATESTDVLATALSDISPTVTVRTFDPEEAGFARNVSLADLPASALRGLTTLNINFAKFLVDRELRYQLYRSEHVRAELHKQGVELVSPSEGIESIYYGDSTTSPRSIAPRKVQTTKNAAEAKKSLERIIAKRLEGSLL